MQTVELSDVALTVLRSRVEGGSRHVNASNLEAYRELARAGIMYPLSGFVGGPECLFRWTDEGYARRFEILGCARNGALYHATRGVEPPGRSPGRHIGRRGSDSCPRSSSPPSALPTSPHLDQNPPGLVANRQFRLRRDTNRGVVIPAHVPFGVLVRGQGVPTIAQTRLRPEPSRPLPIFLRDLLRVE